MVTWSQASVYFGKSACCRHKGVVDRCCWDRTAYIWDAEVYFCVLLAAATCAMVESLGKYFRVNHEAGTLASADISHLKKYKDKSFDRPTVSILMYVWWQKMYKKIKDISGSDAFFSFNKSFQCWKDLWFEAEEGVRCQNVLYLFVQFLSSNVH